MALNSQAFNDSKTEAQAIEEHAQAIYAITAALTEAARLFFVYEFPDALEQDFVKKLRKTNEVVFSIVPNQWKNAVGAKVKALADKLIAGGVDGKATEAVSKTVVQDQEGSSPSTIAIHVESTTNIP